MGFKLLKKRLGIQDVSLLFFIFYLLLSGHPRRESQILTNETFHGETKFGLAQVGDFILRFHFKVSF